MLKEEIQKFFKGDIDDSEETLKKYSKDASLFVVKPKLVVFPKDKEDIEKLVNWVGENKEHDPSLSITVRAAGSCMSGGSLNESIIVDVMRYMNRVGDVVEEGTDVEPGVYYRDFEPKTLENGLILPCYTASKGLNALGGMFGNNSAGERTLRYGQMENFVLESKVVLADGKEYVVKPLKREELEQKMKKRSFEGLVYKKLFKLIEDNKQAISDAKPRVSKNSAGYYLWNVWDGDTFDLNKLLVGSQGTLGVVTEMKLKLMKEKKHHDLVAIFFKSWDEMPRVVSALLTHDPESLETFDEDTLKLGLRFMPEIAKKVHTSLIRFALKFLPEVFIGMRMLGLPKLIILVEVSEESEELVKSKVKQVVEAIRPFKVWSRVVEKDSEEEKFWVMRRESFNLLRQHVKGKRTAPFVDDFCIPTERVPEFLPQALEILKESGIEANIAGHAGNGNFHIIPLMDLTKEEERKKIPVVADKFFSLVEKYKGSITAEHNDGIVRTPYLHKMYSPEVLELFKQTKDIFDPHNIFNPGKKVPADGGLSGGSVEYMANHIATE